MAFEKGKSGNPGGLNPREKAFANSLRLALSREEGGIVKLQRIANKLADCAEEGESWAIKEVADRIDGKAVQQTEITGKDGGSIELSATITNEDRVKALAALMAKAKD